MSGLDWDSQIPLDVGGGPSVREQIYAALRNAMGTGGTARREDGIDALWRQCRAIAIANAFESVERAALQVFPELCTDHIPVYEARYVLHPRPGANDVERRAAISAARYRAAAGDAPSIRRMAQEIDSRADILSFPWDMSNVIAGGVRPFDEDGELTAWPNHSSVAFHCTVLLDVATDPDYSPTPSAADLRAIALLLAMLADTLNVWTTFDVVTSVGFLADISPVGLTAME